MRSYFNNSGGVFWLLVLAIALAALANACKHDPVSLPVPENEKDWVYDPTPASVEYPWFFPEMPSSENNPLTKEGIALGRKLYYEPLLHPQASLSCSSCHLQNQSFTIDASGTAVLAHVNLGWSSVFLWNGKEEGSLEDVMRFEVEEFFGTDVSKLQNHPDYPRLFYEAFGEKTITTDLCIKALSQFFRTMVSFNSRFDQYYPGTIEPTDMEVDGYEIFNSEKGDCFHCHIPPLFTDNGFHNIGLDDQFGPDNEGRAAITGNPSDQGLFKTPTLRNIALTAPYMHDNRFKTLEEVIDHYDHGVKPSPTLDPIMMKKGKGDGLNLTEKEKAALLAFLHSLTDSTYINNPELAKP